MALTRLSCLLSVRSILSISSERVNCDTLDLIYHSSFDHPVDPGDPRSHQVAEGRGSLLASCGFEVGANYISTDMGSASHMVELLVECRLGW